MRMLFCDDCNDTVELVKTCLMSEGIAVYTATSGYAALKLLESTAVDLVVTDYKMPDGDGGMLSFACNERGIPCIVISGMPRSLVAPYIAPAVPFFDKIGFVERLESLCAANGGAAAPGGNLLALAGLSPGFR